MNLINARSSGSLHRQVRRMLILCIAVVVLLSTSVGLGISLYQEVRTRDQLLSNAAQMAADAPLLTEDIRADNAQQYLARTVQRVSEVDMLGVYDIKGKPTVFYDLVSGTGDASLLPELKADTVSRLCSEEKPVLSNDEMPDGAVVGTASLRRELMIRSHYPKLVVKPVRGNVGTRLRKLDEGQFDALIMASAGLKRLGFGDRIRAVIDASVSLPSPGQGALGIEVREGDEKTLSLVSFINSPEVRACTAAEREVSRSLGGSCQVPLAAYAVPESDGRIWLRAMVGNHHTGEAVFAEARGPMESPLDVAAEVLEALRAKGAERILKEVLGS